MIKTLLVVCSVLSALPAQTTEILSVFGGGERSTSVPSLQQCIGIELGSRVTTPEEVLQYAAAVAAASPRVALVEVGRTTLGRRLVHALISSPANLKRLDAIATAHRTMLEQGTAAADDLPVHLLFGMSVHGNEPSGVEAGLGLLWHLASSKTAETESVLDACVIEIALDMNPDGRGRFTAGLRDRGQWNGEEKRGSFAHAEPWPSGRGNGNWFDMNRDWHLQTQPESKARVARCVQHPPQVIADFHEMGSDDGYYAGTPAGPPRNMQQTPETASTLELLGKAISAAQEARGQSLWTADRFPADFPGYGGAWGSFSGAACLTLEQAGAGAGTVERSDGSALTFAMAAANHAATALALVRAAAKERPQIHERFAAHSRRVQEIAAREAHPDFIFAALADASALRLLAETLQRNGITVMQLREAQNLEVRGLATEAATTHSFAAGSLVVSLKQARAPLVRTLLDPLLQQDDEFFAAENSREAAGNKPEQYDMSAWCLPPLFGVPGWRSAALAAEKLQPWAPVQPTPAEAVAAPLAWVSRDNGLKTTRAAVSLLQSGVRLRYAPFEFVAEGGVHAAGSIVALRERNTDAAAQALLQAAVASGWMQPLRSTQTEQGHDVGSWRTRALLEPKIALLVGEDTDSTSAGAAGWVLHTAAGLPVVRSRTSDLARVLADATVLVLPDGRYAKGLPKEALEGFLGRGGVVIAFAGAVKALASKECALLNLKPTKLLEPADGFNGVIVNSAVTPEHWLTYGMESAGAWLLRGDALFSLPDAESKVRVLVRPNGILSGHAGKRLRDALVALPLVMEESVHGGRIVAFCSDPCLRGASPVAWRPLLNAILLGPTLARE